MRTRFVEATQHATEGFNHGKFVIALFERDEWERPCELDLRQASQVVGEQLEAGDVLGISRTLLRRCGWSAAHVFVMDLQTGEGAMFLPGGSPKADLDKHRVWVCPMFEPFLAWLYEFAAEHTGLLPGKEWFEWLPALVELPDAEPALQGYRREGR